MTRMPARPSTSASIQRRHGRQRRAGRGLGRGRRPRHVLAAAAAVEAALRALRPVTPGTQSPSEEASTGRPWSELRPSPRSLTGPSEIAARLGLELTEGSTGGGSDGNFTAALGVPTLDGLGVQGGGAHADDEHIMIDSLPERAALLAALLHL